MGSIVLIIISFLIFFFLIERTHQEMCLKFSFMKQRKIYKLGKNLIFNCEHQF